MSDNLQMEAPHSMASLVGGIISDAQQLIRQEVALARREMQEELNKARSAAVSFAVALAVAIPGALMLGFFLVYLIHWLAGSPDPAAVPLWGCYVIVAALFLLTSGILIIFGKSKLSAVHLVPPQTAETLKENVQWIKKQTS